MLASALILPGGSTGTRLSHATEMTMDTNTSTTTDTGTSATETENTATIAELTIPGDDFALGESITTLDGITFEAERVVAHNSDHVMPYVWASGDGLDGTTIDTALQTDGTVADFEVLVALTDERLYRIEWSARIDMLVHLLAEEGTILAASGTTDGWHLRILTPEHEALSQINDACKANGIGLDIDRIYPLDGGNSGNRSGQFGVTDKQQYTLTVAFEHGYYEIPRAATAPELADMLGISHQALSEQFRRAHSSLVENAVVLGRAAENDHERGDGGKAR